MPGFFRDSVWQFVGVVLAVVAIIVSIVLFFAQRRRKALAYEIVSQTTVLSTTEEVAGKLQILFEGEPVNKVHLLVIKIVNTGNIPITSSDYEREVSLRFTDSMRILSAEVSETSPSNLSAEIFRQEKYIVLRPLLLNARDSVVIKTLISGFGGNLEVDGRIVGVSAVEKIASHRNVKFPSIFLLTLFTVGLVSMILVDNPLVSVMLMGLLGGMSVMVMLYNYRLI